MSIKLFNTLPTKKDIFWQVVLLPTITILRNTEYKEEYSVVSFEWLFWSLTFLINKNDQGTIHNQ